MAVFRRLGFDLLLGKVAMKGRYMDDLLAGWLSPEEDSFALMVLGVFGTQLRAVFPRVWSDFSDVLDSESYGRALEFFVRKLELWNGRAVVLKSQVHMAHIPEILSIFPDARFVMIFRDPVARCASLKAMHESPGRNWCALQDAPPPEHGKALDFSERLLRRYFADRAPVRDGRLVEIRYEDLCGDRFGVLERVYAELSLPGWEICRRAIEKRGPEPKPRSKALVRSDDKKSLERIIETHAPIYESGLYAVPELVRIR